MITNKLILGVMALGLSATSFAQPTKYVVVIEEKTGTWCGFCPLGTVAMDNLENTEENFIGIAIHDSDPMENSYYNYASVSLPDSYDSPYSAADRITGAHAAASDLTFNTRITETPVAAVEVVGYIVSDQMEIRILVEFAEDVPASQNWAISAVVTEDNVTGTSYEYGQANYFSGGSFGALEGAGHDWVAATTPIPASEMEYDHVARVMANDAFDGVDGSIPAGVKAGDRIWYSFYVNIHSSWDPSNLHVVGMLIEPSGTINNAGKGNVGTVGLEEEAANNFAISAYPNPTSEFVNLTIELEENSTVTIEVVNLVGAIVTTIGTQNLQQGTHYNQIDLSDFNSGVYFVRSTVNETVKMTKIVVQQ